MNWTTQNSDTYKEPVKDPRIDSPHIKVVYPTKELPIQDEQVLQTADSTEPTAPVKPSYQVLDVVSPVQTNTEPHTCTLSFTDAIKAHSTAFILAGLAILALGFIIGKNKV